MWPTANPYEITGQPRICASSTVSPAVEWTRASAAPSRSLISVGEPEQLARGARRRTALEPPAGALVVAAQADDRGALDVERRLDRPRRSPIPQPPPETTTTLSSLRQVERSPGVGLRDTGSQEVGGRRRPRPAGAARPGDPLHLLDRLAVGDRVEVDARVGPEAEPREVGDRRDDRDVEAPARAQLAEDGGGARVGRDDRRRGRDARIVAEAAAPPAGSPSRSESHRVGGNRVSRKYWSLEQPGQPVERRTRSRRGPRAVTSRPIARRPSTTSTSAPGCSAARSAASARAGQVVALADVGGEDQDRAAGGRGCAASSR